MKIFESRIAVMKAYEQLKGSGDSLRRTSRGDWSGADLLASWKEDAAICEKLPRDEEVSTTSAVIIPPVQRMCLVRGFRQNPFAIDTMFHGRLHTFTIESHGETDAQQISVGYKMPSTTRAGEQTEEDLPAHVRSQMEEVVARRGTLVDLIEHVLWPLLAKIELIQGPDAL